MTWRRFATIAVLALCAAAPAAAGSLDRIKSEGKIRIGHRADARPFSYVDESGKVNGYSIALCARIVEAVKAELGLDKLFVEYVKVDAGDRLQAVESGAVDLVCGASTDTLSRRKHVSFSLPIFSTGISAVVRSDASDRFKAVLDGREQPYEPRWRANLAQVLEKRTLSAVTGTTAAEWLSRRRAELKVNAMLVEVPSHVEGIGRVLNGRSDAFFGDRALLLEDVARSESAGKLILLDNQYTYEPIALVFARNDEDLRLIVDRTLSSTYRSGEIWPIYQVYFGAPTDNARNFFRLVTLPE